MAYTNHACLNYTHRTARTVTATCEIRNRELGILYKVTNPV